MAVTNVEVSEVLVGDRFRKDYGDLNSLKASIESIGLLHPVVVDSSLRLVAGGRRLEAVKDLGWTSVPVNVVASLDEATSALVAERDENTCRLALTPQEAVNLGKRLEDLKKPEAQKRQESQGERGKEGGRGNKKTLGGISPKGNEPESPKLPTPPLSPKRSPRTNDQVAAALGMDRRTYEKAVAVVESGDQEVIQQMNATGKVDGAFKKIKKKEKAQADAKAAEKATEVIAKTDPLCVFHGNSFELAESIPDESCALIFTDPPYDRKALPMFEDLAELADRILVDGGSLITFLGQYVIPEVIDMMTPRLKFFWINCCLHTGGTAQMREYGIKVKWKPMLWFVKGQFRRDRETWVEDLIVSQQEKESHPWQQSVIEAKYYIDRLTQPGELVVDPFCGGGTTAVAAKELGRIWWTADVEAKHVQTARERLA